jgi:hypothetical protein
MLVTCDDPGDCKSSEFGVHGAQPRFEFGQPAGGAICALGIGYLHGQAMPSAGSHHRQPVSLFRF